MGSRLGFVLVVSLLACSDDTQPITGRPDGSNLPDGPVTADGAPVPDAVDYDAIPTNPGGPDNVTVVSPADGQKVITARPLLECSADPDATSGSPVVAVRFQVRDSAGLVLDIDATPTGSTWQALGVLDSFANGALNVTCVATGADELQATAERAAFLDLGPRVDVLTPTAGAAVHGKTQVYFTVDDYPVESGDTGAAVTLVQAWIAGQPLDLGAQSGSYSLDVELDDPDVFPVPPNGATTLRVAATNARSAVRDVTVLFYVDNAPPDVSIVAPEAGELVGGLLTVTATISDDHGIDSASVIASIGSAGLPAATVEFPLAPEGAGSFTGSFDTRDLRAAVESIYGADVTLVFPTISVRARDLLGNEGNSGETVILDYTPPRVSLDPPRVRSIQWDELLSQWECSLDFDPLGDDAVNDRQSVGQLAEFRARVQDRGNDGFDPSVAPSFLAEVDPDGVQLFVYDDTAGLAAGDALVVDSNGDGVCDEINPALRPGTVSPGPGDPLPAVAIDLAGIAGTGANYFASDSDYLPDWPICNVPLIVDPTVKPRLCAATGLQAVISIKNGEDPIIWSIPPFGTTACVGLPFDQIANGVADGWACVAVRAVDNLGNVGVSRPLRVCFDHDGDGAEGCPALPTYPGDPDIGFATDPVITYGSPPIDCLGVYDPLAGTTNAGATCTLPAADFDFPTGETLEAP